MKTCFPRNPRNSAGFVLFILKTAIENKGARAFQPVTSSCEKLVTDKNVRAPLLRARNPIEVFRFMALLSLLSLLPAAARAQTTPQMTFRPSLVDKCAVSYSYSGGSGYRNGDVDGDTSVQRFDASVSGRHALGPATFLGAGFAVGFDSISSDASVPVPERLGELSVNFGVTQLLSRAISVSVFARPGYYGDFAHFAWEAVNVPVMAMATYTPNKQYTFMFGAGYSQFSEYRIKVMPVLGFRWKFADDWTLNIGIPRLGVTWQATKALELSANASGQGGTYRTTEAPNGLTAPGGANRDLAHTYVSYREIRLGVRAAYNVVKKINIAVEAGWMAERRFNYYDRDFTLKGKPSGYATLAAEVKM